MRRHLRQPALWISAIALFFTASGGAVAALVITGRQIKDETVTTKDIKDGSLLRQDFASGQLQTTQSEAASGIVGPQGPRGDTGPAGPQGPKGDSGSQGVAGPAGSAGAPGAAGAAGTNGLKGDKGDAGTNGAPGATGTNGLKGDQGPKGDPGIQGPKGDAGPSTLDPLPSGTMLYGRGDRPYSLSYMGYPDLADEFVEDVPLPLPTTTSRAAGGEPGCGGNASAPQPSSGYLCVYLTVTAGATPTVSFPAGASIVANSRLVALGVRFSINSTISNRGTWIWAYKAP